MWRTVCLIQRGVVSAASGCTVAKAENLTESCTTQQLTSKNIRRPSSARRKALEDRVRRRRRTRVKLISALEESQKSTASSPSVNGRDIVMAKLADEIFSRGHKHLCCATNVSFLPDGNPAMPEVALAGRGRVGKSSLLRSLFRSSREVGRSNVKLRRDAMNFFNVGGGVFNIVDLPGFGGTSVPWTTVLQHAVLLRNFVRFRPSLKMLYYCIDVHYKHGVYIQDIDVLRFLSKEVPNFTIVLTKGDQLSNMNSKNFRLEDVRRELLFHDITHPVLVTSAYHMGGIDALRFDMVMNCMHALPTERLTLTEAKRLSARLLSQQEVSTVRKLALPPTELQEDLIQWENELKRERASESTLVETNVALSSVVGGNSTVNAVALSGGNQKVEEGAALPVEEMSPPSPASNSAVDGSNNSTFVSLKNKMANPGLMSFVRQTSPWRNPLLWPTNVVPTKHPKANIMRCPEDPGNPYLTQAHFVCPRADMCFRRPNVGVRRGAAKGKYEADRPLACILKPYTIPYFPDIVDVKMHPVPWTFLGSREAFYETGHGRRLGIRMTQYATNGEVRALDDNPAPHDPALTKELRLLETKRYGTQIACLRPPEKEVKERLLDGPPRGGEAAGAIGTGNYGK